MRKKVLNKTLMPNKIYLTRNEPNIFFAVLEVANGEYGNFTDLLAKAATENQWRTAVTSDKCNTF